MKKILTIIGIAAIAIIILIQSCIKEEYELNEIEWNPNIAVPLVRTTLTIADMLEHIDSTSDIHNHLFEDPTGFLTLIYKNTLFSAKASDLLDTFLLYPPGTTISNVPLGFSDTLPIDSIDLNLEIFNKVAGGGFYFEDPKINIEITNSFGVPIVVRFPVLLARSFINTPPTVPIEINGNTDTNIVLVPPINYPLLPGGVETTTYSFDKTNSNIQDVLAISPKYIYYGVIANLNTPPVFPNFVSDTSEFSVEVEVVLPLWGNASDFMLADTLDFELGFNTDTFQTVEYAIFKLNVDNGLPVDVNIQLDFIDSLNPSKILESLLDINSEVFLSAKVVNEVVTQSTPKTTTIPVDRAKLDKIGRANQMIVKAKLATFNVGSSSGPASPLVKFYSDYALDLKLGVRVQLKTTLFN